MRKRAIARAVGSALAVLMATVAASCGGDTQPGTSDDTSQSDSADGRFPVTVDTKFGEVTVPEEPKRVVALGWGDAETALALGVQPVGASDWLEFGGAGVGPWAKGLYDEKPQIIGTLEPSYEDVLTLEPDLILDVKSSGEQERYDRLSEIAPTIAVPEGGDNYLTSQQQQVRMIASALGRPEKGKQLLADVRQQFADARQKHPEFDGATVTVAAYSSNGWGAYIEQTQRTEFMRDLGFEPNPEISKLEPEGFTVRVADENLELLDADLLVIFPIGKTAAEVTEQPGYDTIPAVRDGRSVILDQKTISSAYSLNSVLSIPYALKHVTPLLAEPLSKGN